MYPYLKTQERQFSHKQRKENKNFDNPVRFLHHPTFEGTNSEDIDGKVTLQKKEYKFMFDNAKKIFESLIPTFLAPSHVNLKSAQVFLYPPPPKSFKLNLENLKDKYTGLE